MNDHEAEGYCQHCNFHPKEVIVGICAVCLRERLLNLASKQRSLPVVKDYCSNRSFRLVRRRPKIALTKLFAPGAFLGRFESNHIQEEPDHNSDEVSTASLEDSFISMKFEDNGQASWEDKKKVVEIPNDVKRSSEGKSMVEHARVHRGMLRWQKRIGQLLHIAQWKRSTKQGNGGANTAAIVSKVEGMGRRRGRIWSLTRKRTTHQ